MYMCVGVTFGGIVCLLKGFLEYCSACGVPLLGTGGDMTIHLVMSKCVCWFTCCSVQVSASVDVNPTKCYLDFLSLPNDDHTRLELKQVAAIALSYLDRIAEPYSHIQEVWIVSHN